MTTTRTLLVTAAALAGGAVLAAPAAAALPDLISEPTGAPYVERYHDGRLLLRFSGYVTNAAGAGTLEIRASDPDRTERMRTVRQWRDVTAPGVGGAPVDPPSRTAPTVIFERNDDHDHYHLKDAAEYTLWTDDRSARVAVAQKTEAGFCIEDSDPHGGAYDVAQNNFCWQGHDTGGQRVLVMGISPGFRDVYGSWLSYQWIDISDVAPGRYQLAARVDPDDVVTERSEANNGYAFRPATVPGYRARDVAAPQDGAPVAVTLRADAFDPSGRPVFEITAPPAHGTLSRAVGERFTDPRVVYTPRPGHRGSDGFTFAVRDAGSAYPRSAPTAAAALSGETAAVTIAGLPERIVAGTAVQLTAVVAGAPGGVRWSVDGTPGGDAAHGTVGADGLYIAPAMPPPGGGVVIRATSTSSPSAFAEGRIRVDRAPAVQAAAPATACAAVPSRREVAPGGGGRIVLSGRQLLINQRISQAAVRRANAASAWLDAGIRTRDICGGAIGLAHLGPGLLAGAATARAELTPADPRPLKVATPQRHDMTAMRVTGRQLLVNQRVAQAAIRRLNALTHRLDGRLTGGDLSPGAVTSAKLAADIRIVRADTAVPRPPASRTVTGAAGRPGGPAALVPSARQLRINQRISQEAVRRANAITDQLRAGLDARHFADDTVVARDLAPEALP
jgi:hypothetical protein